jgi:carboxyl-terminal processing protease
MTRVPNTVRWFFVFATGLILGFGLSIGRPVQADRAAAVQQSTRSTVRWQDARLLGEVLEHVRKEYVDDISDEELITAAIKGMMAELDPHSSFLGPEQLKDMRISTRGEYSGVGIEVAAENGMVRVVAPMEGGPAALAGVQAGDRVLAVDGIPVDPEDLNATIDRMRGKVGSLVKLTLSRLPEAVPFDLAMKRAKVQVSSVKARLAEPDLGYVRITYFSETTAPDLNRAVAKLVEQNGRPLAGLVLDLRDNPGGLLEAGVAVADAFLDAGVIVTAEGRAYDARFAMSAKKGDLLDGAPLTVLVNGDSASASEIVAGALRDHRRATLVGRQTYGKGSVQTVVPLSGGYALKLTTSRYYTPSGESIHKTGIRPDVIIDPQQIEAARNIDSSAGSDELAADYELRVALDATRQAAWTGPALAVSRSP